MSKKIAIVGAGVGGLATAARLAHRGYRVEVFEKLPECGGRAHLIEDRGFKFDTGPSFVLMPDFFEEVFSSCGEALTDYLDLKALDTSYKIFYPEGDTLTVYRDSEKTADELEKFEQGSAHAYRKFIEETTRIYKAVRPLLYRCFTKGDVVHPRYLRLLGTLQAHKSYWQFAKKYFNSEKLCAAFTFEAMFIGVSPFKAPAFYSVITYTDHVQKIYHPLGGMYEIPKALEKMGKNFGAHYHYNSEITRIAPQNGSAILGTREGEVEADMIVINADYASTQSTLLKRSLPHFKYSCSVYLIYLGLRQKIAGLEHHNLFFARDLKRNLRQIFQDHLIPSDPSFYVHVPTVTDSSLAPPGKDIAYILVPVPNLENGNEHFTEHEERLRQVIFERVKKAVGIDLESLTEVAHTFYPRDFITRYHIHYGATFGLAHTFFQSAFFRPSNRDRAIKNLYYVGASTQPGGGLPPVIASSRIVADIITAR